MAAVLYVELLTDYRALGGVRLAFLSSPAVLEDAVDLTDGSDTLRAGWPKLHPTAGSLTRGRILLVVFDDGTKLEREIDDYRVSSGPDPLRVVRCIGVGERLRRLRVEQVDADGFVTEEVPIAQLSPATVLATILAGAPTAFVVGTVTPTALVELQFSRDSKLSAVMKLAAECDVEHQFRVTATQIFVDLVVLGATAPALRLRSGQNLADLEVEVQGPQVTLGRAVGGQSDDGGAAGLAWAYWLVGTPSGNVVPLLPIHGAGAGPIGFAGQGTDLRITNLLANPDPSAASSVGTPVVTRDAFVGGGYTLHLVADNDGAALEYLTWAVTIPNVGAAATAGEVVAGWVVKKGTTHVAPDNLQLRDTTAGANRLALEVTWDGSGVPSVVATAGAFLAATAQGDGVYFITGRATGVVPANAHQVRLIPGSFVAATVANLYYGDCVVANQSGAPRRPEPWYLQKKDGTVTRVNAANATTGAVTVGYVTGIAAGDWIRFVANGAKQHLTELETPERVTYGDRPGDQTSEWDDALNILENGTGRDHTAARPAGWTGATGTATKTTTAGEWLTAGQATKIVVASLSGPPSSIAGRTRSWFLHKRRTTFTAIAWVRILSLSLGQIGLRITRAGSLVGEVLTYRSPINGWIQLRIEGLSLEANVGTTQTLGVEVLAVPDPSSNMSATVIVDSLMLVPAFAARGMLEGSGAARMWQDLNLWLDEARVEPRRHRIAAVDLERAGYPRTEPVELGGTVITTESRFGLATDVTERIISRRRDLLRATATEIGTTTAPSRLKAKLAAYKPLTVPFFEPIEIRGPVRDSRQAAQLLKAEITAQTATQVTITLTHSDLLNGAPVISYAPSTGVTYVSGSGLGPYVFGKPASGAGVGRVVFTSQITGRTDAVDAVDVPENSAPTVEMKAVQLSKTADQIVVRVSTATAGGGGATVTVAYDAGGLTISPASGGTTSSMSAITGTPSGAQYIEYTITRPNWGAGGSRVQFTGAATGFQAGTVSVDVPAKERPALLCRASLQTINATTVVVRVAVADPFPPGGASVTVTYAATPAGGVTPASGGTLTPTADIATTGTIDYTIDRPGANAPAKRVTFTAADATNNRIQSSDAIDVPAQDPPSLQLQSNEHSTTQWKITWTATGTVEVSKNNGAYGTPAAAGLTSGTAFNRPSYGSADDAYSFRVTLGGVTISNEVVVPAVKDLTGHSLSISTPFGVDATPGPQKIDISWSTSGMPSGTTYDVEYQCYDAGNAPTGAFGFHANATSTLTVNPSPAFVETDQIRITVYAKHQGKLIYTATRYVTPTF